MIKETALLDRQSLELLAACVGRTWRFVTGSPLTEKPGFLFSWGQVEVACEEGKVAIISEEFISSFEGFESDYDNLRVGSVESSASAAEKRGELSFVFRGNRVVNVSILRETITKTEMKMPIWNYTTDFAIVFELNTGFLAIFKGSHTGSQALQVCSSGSLETLEISDSSLEWTSDATPGEEFIVKRSFFPVRDLL